MGKLSRPECYEFAMGFLGGDEEDAIREYIEKLEAAIKAIGGDLCGK